jgi:4-hydroxy-tetrahydrodipicolinate synthase
MTMKFPNFRGVIPALTTPFRQDLSLDADGFARLADCVIQDGVDGLLVNGCTGESWSLTTDERDVVFRTAVRVARGRVPVVAGCSAITAAEAIGKVRQAERAGCSYVMISPPWYVMPARRRSLITTKPCWRQAICRCCSTIFRAAPAYNCRSI